MQTEAGNNRIKFEIDPSEVNFSLSIDYEGEIKKIYGKEDVGFLYLFLKQVFEPKEEEEEATTC